MAGSEARAERQLGPQALHHVAAEVPRIRLAVDLPPVAECERAVVGVAARRDIHFPRFRRAVAGERDAVGLIGVSWVGNKNDPQTLSFLEKVKIAALECRGCNGVYVKPYQANIAMGRYPMVRPLYYILKENYDGLGSGFSNFLIYEKGQLIFRRAYLLPGRMPLDVREMEITE